MNESAARRNTHSDLPPPAVVEEFEWLMSLALDERSNDKETLRFEKYLVSYPSLATTWEAWRTVDRYLTDMPHVTPVAGFVERFERRLAAHEVRRQRWLLGVVIATVLTACAAAAFTALGAGAFVLLTQGQLIGEQIRNVTYLSTTVANWFSVATVSLGALANTPQAQMLGILYLAVIAAMVLAWVQLLQRSAQPSDAIPAAGPIRME